MNLSKRYNNKCVQEPKRHSRKFHFCGITKAACWRDSGFIVCRIWGQVTSGVRKSIDWRLGVRKPKHGSLGDEEVVWDRRKWRREPKMSWGLSNDNQPAPASPFSVRTRQNTTALREIKREIFCLILRVRVYVFGCNVNIDTFLLLLFISVYTKRIFVWK